MGGTHQCHCLPHQDVIGYWFKPALSIAVEGLIALCVSTRGGMMLCEDPGIRNTVIFRYAEVDMPDSRFANVCQMIKDQFIVPTFFLYDFDPLDIEKLRKRFPSSRIVGICCPSPEVEGQCLGILLSRQVGADKTTASGQPRQPSKYGSDWPGAEAVGKRGQGK